MLMIRLASPEVSSRERLFHPSPFCYQSDKRVDSKQIHQPHVHASEDEMPFLAFNGHAGASC